MKKKTFKDALIEAELKAKVDKFNGVPEKTYPKFLKKLFYVIAAVIAAFGVLISFVDISFGFVFFIPAGFIALVTRNMKTKDDIPSPSEETHSQTETFWGAGVHYYQDDIYKLAVQNPDWHKHTKTLLADKGSGIPVYRYHFINKPVKLIPEPTNPHDKNAIIIQIAGEKVGYIEAEYACHVKEILDNREVAYISGFISGGEYKVPKESGELVKGTDPLRVRVKIGYR